MRRGRRRTPCPQDAELPPRALRDQCEECSALDRSSSVAADTRADDPQPYAVYLACFGAGLHKVGITAVARGPARLLEQGALAFAFLGEGPLMTARRTEAVLGAALGVPDRIRSAAKREALRSLPPAGERAAALRRMHAEAVAMGDRLPSALRLRPFAVVDHARAFGLDPDHGVTRPPTAEVTALVPGGAVSGTVTVAAGHDLHVLGPDARVLLVDARLAAGWTFAAALPPDPLPIPTRPLSRQDAPPLF